MFIGLSRKRPCVFFLNVFISYVYSETSKWWVFIRFNPRSWPSNVHFIYDYFLLQGIDIDHRRGHKAKRTAPKSKDVYLLLLVKVRTAGLLGPFRRLIYVHNINNYYYYPVPLFSLSRSCTVSWLVVPVLISTKSYWNGCLCPALTVQRCLWAPCPDTWTKSQIKKSVSS